jgi:branched-subunit amino acid transport protein
MEIRFEILLLILLSGLVTILPRVLPLVVLSRVELPAWAVRWLRHVPVAVMAALIGQSVLIPSGEITASFTVEMAATLLAFAVAIRTRSLLGTVVAGVACAMVLRMLF